MKINTIAEDFENVKKQFPSEVEPQVIDAIEACFYAGVLSQMEFAKAVTAANRPDLYLNRFREMSDKIKSKQPTARN